MSTARVVEIGETAAGIVVREPVGFRFFAAHPDYQSLEGRVFRAPKDATTAAAALRAQAVNPRRGPGRAA